MKSFQAIFLIAFLAALFAANRAHASKPVEPHAYVQSGPDGVIYARSVPAKGDVKAHTDVFQVVGETDKLFDRYDWFAAGGVVLGWSPIKGQVAIVAAMEGTADDWKQREVLRFCIGGKQIKSYTAGEMLAMGAEELLSSGRRRSTSVRMLRCEQVPGTNEYDFIVQLKEGKEVRFDILTGEPRPNKAEAPAPGTDGERAIAAEIQRLGDAEKNVRDKAIKSLIKTERPAAAALVKAMESPSNDIRTGAAEALLAIVKADAGNAPNYHERSFWEKRIRETRVGMLKDEVVRVLLPDATPEQRKEAMMMGVWSGQSGFSTVRLDDYWTATLQLTDVDREKLNAPPTLKQMVRSIWVQPAANYTGQWSTFFVNGQKANEIQYRDGKYDGTFTAFHDDGTKSYEQHYKAHVCDGTDTGWYNDGTKMYVGTYKADKQDGLWQHWYPDGTPQSAREFTNGDLDGVSISWHENGLKSSEKQYRNGKPDGVDMCWDETGKLLWKRHYSNGELIATK